MKEIRRHYGRSSGRLYWISEGGEEMLCAEILHKITGVPEAVQDITLVFSNEPGGMPYVVEPTERNREGGLGLFIRTTFRGQSRCEVILHDFSADLHQIAYELDRVGLPMYARIEWDESK